LAATGEVSGTLPDMLARAARYYREETDAKRRMLLRVAGLAVGLIWMVCAGAVFIMGAVSYFDFVFRAGDQLWREAFE